MVLENTTVYVLIMNVLLFYFYSFYSFNECDSE